ncbi:hypothetical protein niasHT_010622 [Heterodera trifolii]|uniref:Ubiquitin-like domain-containing protein n=1 Tax=Heterodera trifolii TaxID=157864 RepID=A0ABD2L9U0_9BILA
MVTLMMPSFSDGMENQAKYDHKEFPVVVNEKDNMETEEIKEIENTTIQTEILTTKCYYRPIKSVTGVFSSSSSSSSSTEADASNFHIHVNYGSKQTIVRVKGTDTVEDLKKKIATIDELGNIPIQKQVLFNENTENVLAYEKTMDEYGIGEGDTIYLEVVTKDKSIPPSSSAVFVNGYDFYIRVRYGSKWITVWVKGTDTVEDLKKNIATIDELGNIPIQKQVLTAKITWNLWIDLTDDQKTIDKYGISEGQNLLVSWDEFKFYVEYKEKMYPIKVNAMTATLKELKKKMAEITGIPTEKQTISHYKYGQCDVDNARLIDFVKEDMPFLIMSDGSGITVWWQNRDVFVIYVNGTDTVATVKQKIRSINKGRHNSELNGVIKLSKCDCLCEFAKALADEKTMDEHGIGEGITIYMTIESSPSSSSASVANGSEFHIHVQCGSNRYTVWVKGTDTVQIMKDRFGDKFIKHQSGADIVDNGKTMDEYGIKEGDTIKPVP